MIEKVTAILDDVVRMLVDHPDEVTILPTQRGTLTVLEIRVATEDIGKVVGKQGRTARSLRLLFQQIGLAHNIPVALNILPTGSASTLMGSSAPLYKIQKCAQIAR